MGRVVGGDSVHRAVGDAGKQGGQVAGASERWIHFGVRAVAENGIVGEREVMRRDFTRGVYAPALGIAHQCDRPRGREVRGVEMPAGRFRQLQVARQTNFLRFCGDAFDAEPTRNRAVVEHAA